MIPALQALYGEVRDTSQAREVTLVEFARADLAAALQVFDDIRPRSQIIYVSAPASVRQARLADRAVPPHVRVDGQTITTPDLVKALNSAGSVQDFTITGLTKGAHDIGVTFLNDAWGAPPRRTATAVRFARFVP